MGHTRRRSVVAATGEPAGPADERRWPLGSRTTEQHAAASQDHTGPPIECFSLSNAQLCFMSAMLYSPLDGHSAQCGTWPSAWVPIQATASEEGTGTEECKCRAVGSSEARPKSKTPTVDSAKGQVLYVVLRASWVVVTAPGHTPLLLLGSSSQLQATAAASQVPMPEKSSNTPKRQQRPPPTKRPRLMG
jgi:hypothetical protein